MFEIGPTRKYVLESISDARCVEISQIEGWEASAPSKSMIPKNSDFQEFGSLDCKILMYGLGKESPD